MKRSGFPRRNDAFKKPRVQTNDVVEKNPSRVIHIRGLDDSLFPIDIVKFAIPFGRIKHMVYAKSKGQALIELEELSAAIKLVKYYESHPPGTRNRTYFVQFSKHDKLDNEIMERNPAILEAIESANRQFSESGSSSNNGQNNQNLSSAQGSILRINIEDMKHPVKLDSLHTIFSRYGEVLKIVTYTKYDRFGALIQMENPTSAQAALTNLDGKNIYNGCCVLRIHMSQNDKLVLRYNNEKSRDYTNSNLPAGDDDYNYDDGGFDGGLIQRPNNMPNNMSNNILNNMPNNMANNMPNMGIGLPGLGGTVGLMGNAGLGVQNLLMGGAGLGGGQGLIGNPPVANMFNAGLGMNQTATVGLDIAQAISGATLNPTLNQALGLLVANGGLGVLNQLQAAPTLTNLLGGASNNFSTSIAQTGSIGLPQFNQPQFDNRDIDNRRSGSGGVWGNNSNRNNDYGDIKDGGRGGGDMGSRRGEYEQKGRDDHKMNSSSSRILHVSGLNKEKVTTDVLFILFGLYGNVMRVKILYKFKDKALVEMENEDQANIAVENLRNADLYGNRINVGFSKYTYIPMLKEGADEPWLTKDYSKSHLHRFRISNSKNHHNIFPPSSKLHLSNIPSTDLEELLKEKFSKYGEIRHFEFSDKDQRMAWVQYDSVGTAIEALVELHNMELDETHHLRVAFAPIRNRRDNNSGSYNNNN